MSILEIELTPEMEQQLHDRAKQKGVEAKAYVEAIVTQDLQEEQKRYNVMEFYGSGREAWAGVDVQAYINELRDEWDR